MKKIAVICVIATVLGGMAVAALVLGIPDERVALNDLPAPCRASMVQVRGRDLTSSETACDARRQYIDQVRALPRFLQVWQDSGLSQEDRALCAYAIRREARVAGRAAMPNRVLAMILRSRDLVLYGHADGPTFMQLVEERHDDDKSAAYRSILETAQTTNPWFDAQCVEQP